MKFVSCLLFVTATCSYGQRLQVDGPRSTITFHVRNFGLDVEGSMAGASGSITWDSVNLNRSSFRLSADASTIDTGISLRDRHLKGGDYLDAATYPRLEFISNEVTRMSPGEEVIVSGQLTIKNTSRKITLPVKVSRSGMTTNFAGTFTINRLDYKVGKSSISLGDEVTVQFMITTVP